MFSLGFKAKQGKNEKGKGISNVVGMKECNSHFFPSFISSFASMNMVINIAFLSVLFSVLWMRWSLWSARNNTKHILTQRGVKRRLRKWILCSFAVSGCVFFVCFKNRAKMSIHRIKIHLATSLNNRLCKKISGAHSNASATRKKNY